MRTKGTAAAAVALAALAVAAAGCGSSAKRDAATTAAAAQGPAADDAAARTSSLLKFAECMRKHGFDVPDPSANGTMSIRIRPGSGFDPAHPSPKLRAAQKDCGTGLAGGSFRRGDVRKLQENALAFARCMRAHGVDMPDPTFKGGGVMFGGGGKVDVNSPRTQAALGACQKLMRPVS